MQAIQTAFKCLNESILPKFTFTQVRWKRRHGMPFVFPKYWYREPPQKGVKFVNKYPLEAAQQERADKGYYRLERWTDWRMKKDYLRRQMVIKYNSERLMLGTMIHTSILPEEIRDCAARELQENYPRDSCYRRIVRRCALNSRVRNIVEPWRVGRHMFRQLADYNKLSGVQRGIW